MHVEIRIFAAFLLFLILTWNGPAQGEESESLEARFKKLETDHETLKQMFNKEVIEKRSSGSSAAAGVTYVHWGRLSCNDAMTIYRGHTAGPGSWEPPKAGGGSNFLCLHERPQWKSKRDGFSWRGSIIYGTAYWFTPEDNNVFSFENHGGRSLYGYPAACSACYVPTRNAVLMVPARVDCPVGWIKEYSGYMVADAIHPAHHRSQYICWDEAPETSTGGTCSNWMQFTSAIYPVQVSCGTLPCSRYINGWELTCVVCTK